MTQTIDLITDSIVGLTMYGLMNYPYAIKNTDYVRYCNDAIEDFNAELGI